MRGSNTTTATFAYDASGQRTRSVVTSGSVTTTTTFTYEGLSLFRTVATSPSMTTTLTYLYDEFGRATALAAETSGTAGVTYVRVSTTDRGDVMYLTDILSSGAATPTVLGAWGYDAWGNPTVTSAPRGGSTVPTAVASAIATAQVLRYAGYVYDSFSGLYYCSQRYLDPVTMQFISPDAARADGEQSAYQYCMGDPVNRMDAEGSQATWYDAGNASAADSAINAFRRAKKRALRNYFLALAKSRARAEKKRARARMAAEIAAEKRYKVAQAAKKAAMLAAMQMNSDFWAGEAQRYAEEAQGFQVAAEASQNIGVVCSVVAVLITAGASYQAAESYNEALQAEIDAASSGGEAAGRIDWSQAPRREMPGFSAPGSVRTGITSNDHPWEAHYGDNGGPVGRTDWGDSSFGKPDPHYHTYDPVTGDKLLNHVPGIFNPNSDCR